MKKLFFILTAILITTTHLPAQDILQTANEAYAKGDFTKAIEGYEAALKENGESAAVYYNLGNSYYKAGKIAPSILNYERALLLEPGNGDIRFNLEIAKLKTVDKIEPVGEFFLTSWFHSIEDSLSTDAWSRFAIACFILLIGCLFLFFFSRKILIKQFGFYAGVSLLVLVIFGNIFACNQKKSLTQRDNAVIFVPTTTIKSSPSDSGTDLFILHEGAKVKLKNQIGNWNEIETADGNVGWIKGSEIAVI
ncbi:MAG: tetratricopeptide repeat protein [Dysgonamonadaceae bacterium]|jgi:tetratricopeptide (TPR) repeat protein|nr:tetratricopeptide repeat protein [Dysgonamonadaceae bacterium]